MNQKYKVAGFVKLAKLWERSAEKAIAYHRAYYKEKYEDSDQFVLFDVYVDITGQKEISRRPAMLRVIRDCMRGDANCIAAQTKGYLAANTKEFCYLVKLLFDCGQRIDIVTEDDVYHIDTVNDADQQRAALHKMADDYTSLNPDDYSEWKHKIFRSIERMVADGNKGE